MTLSRDEARAALNLSLDQNHALYKRARKRRNYARILWAAAATTLILLLVIYKRTTIAFWASTACWAVAFIVMAYYDTRMDDLAMQQETDRQELGIINYIPAVNVRSPPYGTMSQYGDDMLENFNRAPTNIVSLRVEGDVV